MGLLNFSLPLFTTTFNSSEPWIVQFIPQETARFSLSHSCIVSKRDGFSLCSSPENNDQFTMDLYPASKKLREQISPRPENGFAKLRRHSIQTSNFDFFWLTHLPVLRTLSPLLKEVKFEEDRHALISWSSPALRRLIDRSPLFQFEENPFHAFGMEVAYVDTPPIPRTNLFDLLSYLYDQDIELTRHGIRRVTVNPATGNFEMDENQKTRSMIRKEVETLARRVKMILKDLNDPTLPIITRDLTKTPLYRTLQEIVQTYENLEKKFDRAAKEGKWISVREKAYDLQSLLLEAKHEFVFPQMTRLSFKESYLNRKADQKNMSEVLEALRVIIAPYQDLLSFMQWANYQFTKARQGDSVSFAQGIRTYRAILHYLPTEKGDILSYGRGPATALGGRELALLIHLLQDSIAHCQVWRKDQTVCEEEATYSISGLGKPHTDENDELLTRDGKQRKSTIIAKKATEKIANLLQSSEDLFEIQLQQFLNEFYSF